MRRGGLLLVSANYEPLLRTYARGWHVRSRGHAGLGSGAPAQSHATRRACCSRATPVHRRPARRGLRQHLLLFGLEPTVVTEEHDDAARGACVHIVAHLGDEAAILGEQQRGRSTDALIAPRTALSKSPAVERSPRVSLRDHASTKSPPRQPARPPRQRRRTAAAAVAPPLASETRRSRCAGAASSGRRPRGLPETSTILGADPPRKHRVTWQFRRSDCERRRAALTQRSPTSTRPSTGAPASKSGAARRSGTMIHLGKHPAAHGKNRSSGCSPNVQRRAPCPRRPQ